MKANTQEYKLPGIGFFQILSIPHRFHILSPRRTAGKKAGTHNTIPYYI